MVSPGRQLGPGVSIHQLERPIKRKENHGFDIKGFGPAMLGSVLLSLLNLAVAMVFGIQSEDWETSAGPPKLPIPSEVPWPDRPWRRALPERASPRRRS
jgi:hypothetical protein